MMASTGEQSRMFEDFKPTSEWQQDAQSHSLILSLPGFKKEQLRVSTEGHNTIRARGERPLGGNKWSRFSQDFEVPHNSDLNSTRATFQQGILTIHVPKIVADKPHDLLALPPTADIRNRNQPEEPRRTNQDRADNTTSDRDDAERKHISSLKEHNAVKKTAEGERNAEGRKELGQLKKPNFEANEELNDGRKELGQSKKGNFKADEELNGGRKELGQSKKGNFKADEELNDGRKELGQVKKANLVADEKLNEKRLRFSNSAIERCRKVVKGIGEVNDERQLMVNVGAAVLVIMALSAYVTYKFVAAGEDKE